MARDVNQRPRNAIAVMAKKKTPHPINPGCISALGRSSRGRSVRLTFKVWNAEKPTATFPRTAPTIAIWSGDSNASVIVSQTTEISAVHWARSACFTRRMSGVRVPHRPL
jgi:hypothetical protein